MYSVYKHIVPNGKIYVGITKAPPEQRWHNGAGYKENRAFWKDILFYGWGNITHEIVATGLSEQEARKKEYELIIKLHTNDPNYGYNVAANEPKEQKTPKEKTITNVNLLKAKMVMCGDTDCVTKLMLLLNTSRTTASNKLNGKTTFTQSEIALITMKYGLSAEDIKEIFVDGVE